MAFPKSHGKMKKNIKLLTAASALAMLGCFALITTSVKANVVDQGEHKKLKICNVASGGEVTQLGNTCEAGENTCHSNPCGE